MSREFRINSFKLFSLFFALFPLLGIYASGIQGVSLGDFCLLITAILIMDSERYIIYLYLKYINLYIYMLVMVFNYNCIIGFIRG